MLRAIENHRGRVRWERLVAEIEERGESLDFRDYVVFLPPDAANAMRHPFFDSAERNDELRLFDARPCLEAVYAGLPEELLDRPFESLSDWQAALREQKEIEWLPSSRSAAEDVLWATRGVAEAELNLEEAFARPRALWAAPAPGEEIVRLPLPRAPDFKKVMKRWSTMVNARVLAYLETKRPSEGLRSLGVLVSLCTSAEEERTLLSALQTRAKMELVCQVVEGVIFHPEWRIDDLKAIQERLGNIDLLVLLDRGLRLKRATIDFYLAQAADETDLYGRWPGIWARLVPGWVYQNRAALVGFYERGCLRSIDLDSRRVSPASGVAEVPGRLRPYGFLAFYHSSFPFDAAIVSLASTQARQDLLRVACAWQRYRIEEGHDLRHVGDLVPRHIERLPHDMATGESLKVRRLEDGAWELALFDWRQKGNRLVTVQIPSGEGL